MAMQPWRLVGETLTPGVARVLAPHLFLPLFAWRWSVAVLPILVLFAASTNPQIREFGIYYAIPLVPFLVPAASLGALAVARRADSARAGRAEWPRRRSCSPARSSSMAIARDTSCGRGSRRSARRQASCARWRASASCWCRAASIRTRVTTRRRCC